MTEERSFQVQVFSPVYDGEEPTWHIYNEHATLEQAQTAMPRINEFLPVPMRIAQVVA